MKIRVERVEYTVRRILWTQPGDLHHAVTLCLTIFGTYRGNQYRADFDMKIAEDGLSRVRVCAAADGVARGAAKGGVLREKFYALGCTLAAAWRTTAGYDEALLRCTRKDLVRAAERWNSEVHNLADGLRAAKKQRTAARRALVAFDKKHPEPTTEIPF